MDSWNCATLLQQTLGSADHHTTLGPLPSSETDPKDPHADVEISGLISAFNTDPRKPKITTGTALQGADSDKTYFACYDGITDFNIYLTLQELDAVYTDQPLGAGLAEYKNNIKIYGANSRIGPVLITLIAGGGLSWPEIDGNGASELGGGAQVAGVLLVQWIPQS
jgi:hypothetical protein